MMLLPFKLGLGGRSGSGKQWLSWIHVQDLIRAMAHLWPHEAGINDSKPENEPRTAGVSAYNFGAPGAVHQREFARAVGNVLRRPTVLPMPAWPLRLALGEQSDLILEGQRVVPTALTRSGFVFDFPDIHSALLSLCDPTRSAASPVR